MSLSFVLARDDDDYETDFSVVVYNELVDYLASLSGFPSIQSIGHFDPYGDSLIGSHMLCKMRGEINKLRVEQAAQAFPGPPSYVGLEFAPKGEGGIEFGREGFAKFLDDFRNLIDMAIERKLLLLAIGD